MMKVIEKYYFFLLMITGLFIGASLRLYRIGSQIIWDDEWHGISSAVLHSLKYILTHFEADDNCIPLSAYYRIMLYCGGLNEIIVRLPQILSGILILIVFPLIARKLFNYRLSLIFLFMLSISPLLIYFSRFARPYSIVVFLSFVSVFCFYFWITEGKRTYSVVYVIAAVLAIYFSPSSAGFVTAPVPYLIILYIVERKRRKVTIPIILPSLKTIVILIAGLAAGIIVCLLPAAGTLGEITSKVGESSVDFHTLARSAFLFCGSRSYILCMVLAALFVFGLPVLYMQDKVLFSYLLTICLLHLFFIVLSGPRLVRVSTVFTRYFLPTLPIFFIIISLALDNLHTRLTSLYPRRRKIATPVSALVFLGLLSALFFTGPLPEAYSFPNDFTNHMDFQYKYLRLSLPRIADARKSMYPQFYRNLKDQPESKLIIEFPAVISWTWNIFHVYQRFHHWRVLIGYDSKYFGPFFGYPLLRNKGIRFNSFIDISDPQALLNSSADLFVIHKNIWKECAAVGFHSPENRRKMKARLNLLPHPTTQDMAAYVKATITSMTAQFGNPFYEDKWIVVYSLK